MRLGCGRMLRKRSGLNKAAFLHSIGALAGSFAAASYLFLQAMSGSR
jgi:hypothetical protein